MFDHFADSTRVPSRMDEGKTYEPTRMAGRDARDGRIRSRVVQVERRHDYGFVDPRRPSTPQIRLDRCVRVPPAGQPVPPARLAVGGDDHALRPGPIVVMRR